MAFVGLFKMVKKMTCVVVLLVNKVNVVILYTFQYSLYIHSVCQSMHLLH